MKNLCILLMVIVVFLTFACDRKEEEEENIEKLTMTTAKKGLVKFTLYGSETAIINWGDGTPNDTAYMGSMDDWPSFSSHSHNYSGSATRTITITGGKIKSLYCGLHSGNTDGYYDNNQLISLDVSLNTTLISLSIWSNLFKSEGLNALFSTLHSKTITDYDFTHTKYITISDNPGTSSCNKSIAEEKGWVVVY